MFGRITKSQHVISIALDRRKVQDIFTFLPGLLIVMAAFLWIVNDRLKSESSSESPVGAAVVSQPTPDAAMTYPERGSSLNPDLFSLQLPPPPLDALPYDIREPLSNGTSVPVKKRWLWIPNGQAIEVSEDANGLATVTVPLGAMWWKEFYVQTDRSAFLIERRIIVRVKESQSAPNGWAYYSSHYLPQGTEFEDPVVVPSMSHEANLYQLQPNNWLATQSQSTAVEVRFEDTRGVQYAYVFPGQTQCAVCHAGSSGAYDNLDENPIEVFGLHPNNLTPASFEAIVKRGWIKGGEALITDGSLDAAEPLAMDVPFEETTSHLVGLIRNNCASCHNASPIAAANFTAFIIDPNYDYTSSELMALLNQDGRMFADANPLVTPGQLENSEIWLRINGLDGRRRMPPLEGGLPEVDPKMIDAWKTWIMQAGAP